ncbi:hypothetical protein [Coxiella-like endosymbiont]|uniref:hypothetical protein n=1 Tax=Coxiella-like endosymbiont TaxID=1592897 RepID=UPI0027298B72|nr:hypothetical protein [Coxiella-like endosymbiont]
MDKGELSIEKQLKKLSEIMTEVDKIKKLSLKSALIQKVTAEYIKFLGQGSYVNSVSA